MSATHPRPDKLDNLRRAVVVGSAALLGFAVLQAQPGCDAKTPDTDKASVSESTPAKAPETKKASKPDSTPSGNQNPVPAAAAVSDTEPQPKAADDRVFFPASKSGIVSTPMLKNEPETP